MAADDCRVDLTRDFVLPTLLFAALGGMTWAVRGSSGFGAVPGCLFAGVTWGAAWWYIAREPSPEQSRRYASGWIILALTLGIGLSGARGWMQWPTFFEGHIQTNTEKGEFESIPRGYGFLWLFIAGVPWAGLGACLLAWCGSLRETRVCHWILRIACGVGAAVLARWIVVTYPEHILPLYQSLEARYHDVEANPNLRRLTNDCTAALVHLGFYLGFLFYELVRRDWKNSLLIATVGLVNGSGWALCQNWKWAPGIWGNANFNFWRCWESSGGISIGIAYGIAYFLVNRRMSPRERARVAFRRFIAGPNFEWLLVYLGLTTFLGYFLRPGLHGWGSIYLAVALAMGALYYFKNRGRIEWGGLLITAALVAGLFVPAFGNVRSPSAARFSMIYSGLVMAAGLAWYLFGYKAFEAEKTQTTPIDGDRNIERLGLFLGLLAGLGLSIRNGLKGWFNIYKGNEAYWDRLLWEYFGWVFLIGLIAIAVSILFFPVPRDYRGDPFPHAYGVVWLVLVVQNAIAQLITGPLDNWNEMAFNIYYALLFAITAVIVVHFHSLKAARSLTTGAAVKALGAESSSAGHFSGEG